MSTQLERLRDQIHQIEGRTKTFAALKQRESTIKRWQFGDEAIDACLPEGALSYDSVHDFSPDHSTNAAFLSLLAALLIVRLPRKGRILWCTTLQDARENGVLYGPGLRMLGLDPGRMIIAHLKKERDLAFVLEEATRAKALAAVVGEGPPLSFTATRRLVLAAQESGTPCLTLNTGRTVSASAATTRWRVAPIVGPPNPEDPAGPGFPAWSLTLTRARGSAPFSCNVCWNDETHSFNLVSPSRDGALLPREAQSGQILPYDQRGNPQRRSSLSTQTAGRGGHSQAS
ncbi:MAG: hypothetical protein AAF468_05355 [Pseudomonadota bacterium]